MKKIFLIIGLVGVVLMQFQTVRAQYVTIPDSNFVTWLNDNGFFLCLNGNQLDTTCLDVTTTTLMDIQNAGISDLSGIKYFDSLQWLIATENPLNTLPTLPSSLKILTCSHNQIVTLPTLPGSLTRLECDYNFLNELPLLPNTIKEINCTGNLIVTMPVLPSSLTGLYCGDNDLTSLPNLPSHLAELSCESNQLTTLPVLPDTLRLLIAMYNQLGSLPALPDSLYYLSLSNNPQLNCLPPLLVYFGDPYSFNIDSTNIICLPNVIQHSGYIAAIDTMPICQIGDPCYIVTCDAPTNSSANNLTSTSALIKWNMENDALKYRVRVKNMSTGIVNLYFVNAPDTTKSLTNLSPNTTYQVKIKSQCSTNGSILSPWSDTITFTTSGASNCTYPTNISATPTSNSTATISWTPVSGAAGYRIRYKQTGATVWIPIPINNGSTSSYNLTSLSPNTTYQYQIKTKCSINPLTWSNFSPIQTFTTPTRLGENEIASQIQLYPNPSNGNVTFNSNDLVGTLYVYDIVGKEILHQVVSKQTSLTHLPGGMLTYRFITENGLVAMDRFVVIKN